MKENRALRRLASARTTKALSAAIAAVLVLCMIVPGLASVEWPESIERFERMSPVETHAVEQGTEAADLELPESLRAVVPLPEGADPSTFLQAQPVADTSDGSESYDYYWYGYVAPRDADDIYAKDPAEQERAVYAIYYAGYDADGEPTGETGDVAWRVYGSIDGGANQWFACDEDGTVAGQVVNVPVIWDVTTYEKDVPGTYTVEASFSGYAYSQPRPFAKVTVEEKKECTCGAGNDADASAHAEDCALYEHVENSEVSDDDLEAPDPAPAVEELECTCGAAEGGRHAEDCPLYAEPAKDCACAPDGGPIAADNFPWAHQESCPNFSPIECTCKETVSVEGYNDTVGDIVSVDITGDYTHMHDPSNADCLLHDKEAVQFKKLDSGDVSYMAKEDVERILKAQEEGEYLYPALGKIEEVLSGASEDDQPGIIESIIDFFTPEEAHASTNGGGSNDINTDNFMRSSTPTSGNPDASFSFEGDLVFQKGSWVDYLNTIWMNKAFNQFAWTPHSQTGAYMGWTYGGTVANQTWGTPQTNQSCIPSRSGIVWNVYSGEQLRYALMYCLDGDQILLGGNIDLNGSTSSWATVDMGNKFITFDGQNNTIYNYGMLYKGGGPSVYKYDGLYRHYNPTGYTSARTDVIRNVTFKTAKLCSDSWGLSPIATAQLVRISATNYAVEDSLVYAAECTAGLVSQNYTMDSTTKNCLSRGNYIYGKSHVSGAYSGVIGRHDNDAVVDNLIVGTGGHSGGLNSCAGGYVWYEGCLSVNEMYSNCFSGMLAGHQYWGDYSNCFASGKIEGSYDIGGLIGIAPQTMTATGNGGGTMDGNGEVKANVVTVKNCYSTTLVGLRVEGDHLGGLIGSIGRNYSYGLTISVKDSYAAGEVGNFTTKMEGPVSIGGMVGTVRSASNVSVAFNTTYYDKQTTAMREWATGKSKSVAGISGVLTSNSSNAAAGTVTGLGSGGYSSTEGSFKGFTDNTQWTYTSERYPQLNRFANASSADWGTADRASLVRAYSLASTATVFLNTWSKGYDWSSTGVRTKDEVTYSRVPTSESHRADNLTYDTVREIVTDAPVTTSASWSHMIPGGAPVDTDGDGVSNGGSMDVTAANGLKIKAPGMDWLRIGSTSGGQEGYRPIRLISYMDVDAGSDETLQPGDFYDHRDGVQLTMMDAITEDLVVGMDDARIWSTAKTQNYPSEPSESKKFYNAYTTPTSFSASKHAWVNTEIWRAKQNPDGTFVYDSDGNLVPEQSVMVTGASSGTATGSETLTDKAWLGEFPLYEDVSVDRKYIVTYFWVLDDGRYRTDEKVVTLTPGDYELTVDVLSAEDDAPNADALRLGAAEDDSLLNPGYTLSGGPLSSFTAASRVPYTRNSSIAWKPARDTVQVVKARVELTTRNGSELMGRVDVNGPIEPGDVITVPTTYRYNTHYYDPEQVAQREKTSQQTVNVSYTVEQDADGGMYLRFNKLANPPSFELAVALQGGDGTGIASTATDENGAAAATAAYINETQHNVKLTLWVDEGMPFEFQKVDEKGDPMAGVDFRLYGCSHVHDRSCGASADNVGKSGYDATCSHYHKTSGGSVVAGDNHSVTASGEPGNCWDASNPLYAVTTGADGMVSFDELVTGDYMLVETATADGYQLPHGQWLLRVDSVAGTVDIIARGETPPAFKVDAASGAYSVANYRQWVLPFSGGVGTVLVTVLGVVLVVGGAALFLASRTRRK